MPPVKVARKRLKAIVGMAAYTLSGAVASLVVGGLLGHVGGILLPGTLNLAAIGLTIVVAGAAALREIGLISFVIPQSSRQTNVMWGRTFMPAVAAVLWGMDLGLVVTTRQTFAGIWSVVVFATASRHAVVGAAVVMLYWLGRAAQVWIAIPFVRNANDAPRLLREVFEQHAVLQRIHVAGLIWAIGVLGFYVREGTQLW